MENRQHSCPWRSKHQSEATSKNHQIPLLDIAGAEAVECQSYSYICRSWCFGNSY